MRRFHAGTPEAGERVDLAIARWAGESRSWAQRQVDHGNVTIDGHAARNSSRLEAGQVVELTEETAPEPPAPAPAVPIRWRDEHLAVVVKPAGLVVHAGSGTQNQPTLVEVLQAQGVALAQGFDAQGFDAQGFDAQGFDAQGFDAQGFDAQGSAAQGSAPQGSAPQGAAAQGSDPDRPGIVHRLDRGTSGVLVVASTETARGALVDAFRRREVERSYWALVDGHPDPRSATIEAPIGRDPSHRTRFTTIDGGRHAVTHYDVDETHRGCAEVTVRLETGRTHQVRVHLSAVGHPVCGDLVYGASPALTDSLGLDRPALHAASLAFTHPVTGERIAVTEPLPDDLSAARAAASTTA